MAKKAKAQATPQVKVVSIESITSELVKNVTEQMNGAGIQLSPRTVMEVLKMAMEAVEGSPVKGAEQKDLAIKVVLEIASNAGLPEDQFTIIRALVDGGFVSDTIDLVIAASQGKLNINQVQEVAKGCFRTCFSAMFKKRPITNAPAHPAQPQQSQQQTQQQPQQQQQQPQQQPQQQLNLLSPVPQPTIQANPVASSPMVAPTQVEVIPTKEEVVEVPVQLSSNNITDTGAGVTEQM